MSSWEGDPDAPARRSSNGDDADGAPAWPDGGPPATRLDPGAATRPGQGAPPSQAPTGLGIVPADERGVDPFPSAGSLAWAPDSTEQVPVLPPDPTVGAPVRPDPGARTAAPAEDWPAPTGGPLSAPGHEPSHPPAVSGRHAAPMHPGQGTAPRSPAYGDEVEQPARFARHGPRSATGATRRPLRTDHLALGAVGVVLVVAVAALLLVPDGGGSDDPGEPATDSTLLVGGDATDPAGPIVGTTGVIGSWSGSEWVPRPDGEQPGAGLEYTVLGLGDAFDTARGEATAEDCATDDAASGTDIAVDLGAAGDGPPPIAVAGIAEPRPRPVEQLSTNAPIYQQAAADVAAGLGATAPPTLTQLLRADLDGNGTDEILVSAEHISDPAGLSPTAGDWSVVFLRRVATGGVATDVLASSVVGAGAVGSAGDRLERIQVATLADLNRDGTMEVAVTARSAAGEWTAIHAIGGDGAPSEVLRAGCEG